VNGVIWSLDLAAVADPVVGKMNLCLLVSCFAAYPLGRDPERFSFPAENHGTSDAAEIKGKTEALCGRGGRSGIARMGKRGRQSPTHEPSIRRTACLRNVASPTSSSLPRSSKEHQLFLFSTACTLCLLYSPISDATMENSLSILDAPNIHNPPLHQVEGGKTHRSRKSGSGRSRSGGTIHA
jgi:hypothetical protein